MTKSRDTVALTFSKVLHDLQIMSEVDLHLDQEDENLFKELIQDLKIFESIQTNWLSTSSSLTQYWQNGTVDSSITQEKLNEEVQESLFQSAQFATNLVETILLNIISNPNSDSNVEKFPHLFDTSVISTISDNGRYQEIAQRYPVIFNDIVKCALAVKKHAETINPYSLNLDKAEYVLAEFLGARYLPFQQYLDPLRGQVEEENQIIEWKGACAGHVDTYGRSVTHKGIYSEEPRHTENTYYAQKNQGRYKSVKTIKCKTSLDIWSAIEQIIAKINDKKIYEFAYLAKERGHSMGIRKLPNGEIEFFDPNRGIFVFSNEKEFRQWLALVMFAVLKNEKSFHLMLNKIGSQPADAKPSIPTIKQSPCLIHENIKFNLHGEDSFLFLRELSTIASLNGYEKKIKFFQDLEIVTSRSLTSFHLNKFMRLVYKDEKNKGKEKKREKKQEQEHKKEIEKGKEKVNTKEKEKEKNKDPKELIIEIIESEKKRLADNWWGNSEEKIKALTVFQDIIKKAPPAFTLINCIQEWLSTKNSNNKTYRDIITEHRIGTDTYTKTYQFILNLAASHEINKALIKIQREELIQKITKLISKLNKLYSKESWPMNELNRIIKNYACTEQKSRNSFLLIQEISKTFNNNPLAFNTPKISNQELATLIKILKKMDTTNYKSMFKTIYKLENLITNVSEIQLANDKHFNVIKNRA